ncbi:glycosyltransferase family 4 protein [Sulfitobacter aestuarii]|uniref:Glycosyltransferase family 4 protein n=1 Tax=Sulfitobacter aestuarii TaxID=2161676 RepID=A0ABW5U5M2_9RHOB
MRILVLAPQPFFVTRGTPIAVRALLQVLASLGHRCDALVLAGGTDPQVEGVRLRRVPVPGRALMPPGFSPRKLAADALMLPMAAQQMWREKYDLVIAVEEAAFIAQALKPFFGVPYLCDIDSSITEQLDDKFGLPGWLRRLFSGLEARVARGSIGAITCCRALQELVERQAPGLPVQTLEDVTLLSGDLPETGPMDCDFADPVVMYVGNLEGYQGVGLLIEGFALAHKAGAVARLVIIGGSPAHVEQHQELARTLGVAQQVSLLGPRPVEQIGDYLGQATIVCSPRTKGRNTPMKVYSYLDSGKPLLATRLPTHTQVLSDEIAMLVTPEPEDVARGLTRLLEDPVLRAGLAARARDRVAAEFSPEAYARKLTRFLADRIEPRLALGRGS